MALGLPIEQVQQRTSLACMLMHLLDLGCSQEQAKLSHCGSPQNIMTHTSCPPKQPSLKETPANGNLANQHQHKGRLMSSVTHRAQSMYPASSCLHSPPPLARNSQEFYSVGHTTHTRQKVTSILLAGFAVSKVAGQVSAPELLVPAPGLSCRGTASWGWQPRLCTRPRLGGSKIGAGYTAGTVKASIPQIGEPRERRRL
jgi:hypothetical protein